MLALVIGGSGSGKSAYAEDLVCKLSGQDMQKKRYYLATMEVFGEEGQKRVEKHRRARAGKGFITIEQKQNLTEAIEKIEPEKSVCLLECLSNLVANEMFQGEQMVSDKVVTEKVTHDIESFYNSLEHLVIVSNQVFEDGIQYDETTMDYNRSLADIHLELAKCADFVVEVVAGIPVIWKGNEVAGA